eukprot:EG_transcript_37813
MNQVLMMSSPREKKFQQCSSFCQLFFQINKDQELYDKSLRKFDTAASGRSPTTSWGGVVVWLASVLPTTDSVASGMGSGFHWSWSGTTLALWKLDCNQGFLPGAAFELILANHKAPFRDEIGDNGGGF